MGVISKPLAANSAGCLDIRSRPSPRPSSARVVRCGRRLHNRRTICRRGRGPCRASWLALSQSRSSVGSWFRVRNEHTVTSIFGRHQALGGEISINSRFPTDAPVAHVCEERNPCEVTPPTTNPRTWNFIPPRWRLQSDQFELSSTDSMRQLRPANARSIACTMAVSVASLQQPAVKLLIR
jgi:hypothetical protein